MQREVTHNSLNLTPVRKMTLEYIGEDELVEITPESIRLRKRSSNPACESSTLSASTGSSGRLRLGDSSF
jgi:predicted membrane GTPase involved in stress response